MTDLPKRLADRLALVDNPLAVVVSMHVFVEFLLNRLIEQRAADTEVAERIITDTGRHTFSVKLNLAQAMGLIDRPLRANLDKLTRLRNAFAHHIDVDLPERLFGVPAKDGFLDRNGNSAFAGSGLTKDAIQNDPKSMIAALLRVRDVTFGWFHDVCAGHGVDLSP